MIFDKFFTPQFFQKPNRIAELQAFNVFPLPGEEYMKKDSELQDFLRSEHGPSFLAGATTVINNLRTWCDANQLNLLRTYHNQNEDGTTSVIHKNLIDSLLEHFNLNRKQGNVAYPLYSEGIPLLYELNNLLNANNISLQKKREVVLELTNYFEQCVPRIHTEITNAYTALCHQPNLLMMKFKTEAVEEIVMEHILPHLDYFPGNEVHVAKGIQDVLCEELGIEPSHDGFATKPDEWIIDEMKQILPKYLTVNYIVDKIVKTFAGDIETFKNDINNLYPADNDVDPNSMDIARNLIMGLENKLDKYGKDEAWSSKYLADEDDEIEFKFQINPDIESQLYISILKRLKNSGFVHYEEIMMMLEDKQIIHYVPDHNMRFSYLEQNNKGALQRKPLLKAMGMDNECNIVKTFIANHERLGEVNFSCFLIVCLYLMVEDLHCASAQNKPLILAEYETTLNACTHDILWELLQKQIHVSLLRINFQDWNLSKKGHLAKMLLSVHFNIFLGFMEKLEPDECMQLVETLGRSFIIEMMLAYKDKYSLSPHKDFSKFLFTVIPAEQRLHFLQTFIKENWEQYEQVIEGKLLYLAQITTSISDSEPDVSFLFDCMPIDFLKKKGIDDLISFCKIFARENDLDQFLLQKLGVDHLVAVMFAAPNKCSALLSLLQNPVPLLQAFLNELSCTNIPLKEAFDYEQIYSLIKKTEREYRADCLRLLQVANNYFLTPVQIYKILKLLPDEERLPFLQTFIKHDDDEWYNFKLVMKMLCLLDEEGQKWLLDEQIDMTLDEILMEETISTSQQLLLALKKFNNHKLKILNFLDPNHILIDDYEAVEKVLKFYLSKEERETYLASWTTEKLHQILPNGKAFEKLLTLLPKDAQLNLIDRFSQLAPEERQKYHDAPSVYSKLTALILTPLSVFSGQKRKEDHDTDDQDPSSSPGNVKERKIS